jgi:DNA polymerase III epsilon subunit-like protein
MREIVFDTETTGMDPADGDRVVEIINISIQSVMSPPKRRPCMA